MNIRHAIALTGLFAATACISTLTFAQDSGWYIGAGGGIAKAKDWCGDTVAVGESCDDTKGTFSAFGGYQFNRFLGGELGYTYLGKFDDSDATGTTVTARIWGIELLGVGTFPISPQFEIYAKAGAFFWDVKGTCDGILCAASSQSETGTDLTYGLGAQFNFSKYVGLRVQYQRYDDVGKKSTTGETDIDVISLAIVFKL